MRSYRMPTVIGVQPVAAVIQPPRITSGTTEISATNNDGTDASSRRVIPSQQSQTQRLIAQDSILIKPLTTRPDNQNANKSD